jgi:L-arabinonolactonase
MTEVRCAVAANNVLGEGPVWCPIDEALYWVDIEGRLLQRFHPKSKRIDRWSTPERLCSFALRERGGLLAAFASGVAFYSPETGAVDWIARLDADKPHNRLNDGKCDRAGRFFVGAMDSRDDGDAGRLFRVDPDLSVHVLEEGVGISNSIAWSLDERIFYFADTRANAIFAYDYDPATGAIANRRVFAETLSGRGAPDGSTIDEEGFLWNAEWGGWRLTRYAPDGRVDRVVPLPVAQPTSCMFGGADLKTLFVTSATFALAAKELSAQPWAGALMETEVGVRGLPAARFKG